MKILGFIFLVMAGEFIVGSIDQAINPAIQTSLAMATVNTDGPTAPAIQRWYNYTYGWARWGMIGLYLTYFVWMLVSTMKEPKPKEDEK